MGLYLNQLPPTEVARLKAELAETLIANFCYPRFYDYRVNALRMRPVDRIKRQEVWQYLNAVDFNVWGRVDVDSPDFQRQVERLFIHFVQRNRNFFGPQGRRRMADVRALITSTSGTLAAGLRGHIQGKPESPPFGSPRPVFSWQNTNATGQIEPPWEQILASTMQLQQQLLEVRNEGREAVAAPASLPPVSGPLPALATPVESVSPPLPQTAPLPPSTRPGSVPTRRPRPVRGGIAPSGSNGIHDDEAAAWPTPGSRTTVRPGSNDARLPPAFAASPKEAEPAAFAGPGTSAEAAPTMPLPLSKSEHGNGVVQEPPQPTVPPTRSRRTSGKAGETGITPSGPIPAVDGESKAISPSIASTNLSAGLQPASVAMQTTDAAGKPVSAAMQSTNAAGKPASAAMQTTDAAGKPAEGSTVLINDEDVVIFEQLRHQLVVWLRVEAVRASLDLTGQNVFQLIETLRHQDGVDLARLQVVSTLLNMCDQIISGGRATLFDYKQAMMFYLMHTRRAY